MDGYFPQGGIFDGYFHVPPASVKIPETLGIRMRRAMKAKGVRNAQIAAATGKHLNTVSKWLSDAQEPDGEALEALAQLLGVTTAWLRRGEAGAPVSDPAGTVQPPLADAIRELYSARRLPPNAYARLYGYLERFRKAGATEEQIDTAERIMVDSRYSKLHKGRRPEPSEADLITDIDAGWAVVWEIATNDGMRIAGPRPRFGKAEEGA